MRIENTQKHIYNYDENKPIYSSDNSKVYIADDIVFNRKVCLKIIYLKNDVTREQSNIKKEIIALSKAGNASNHVPMLLDYWTDTHLKQFCIVMQLICGESLRKKMEYTNRNTFNNWMISLCDTLHAVHTERVQHKDIKPENVMITPSGDVYLIDFNISIAKPNLKQGTEFYRAPEMYQSGITVARNQSDIFSLGVMMYEYYTGKKPVDGVNYGTDMFSSARADWGYFTSPCTLAPGMPKSLNDIIEKCMKKNPEHRYRLASELKRDLIKIAKEIRGWTN